MEFTHDSLPGRSNEVMLTCPTPVAIDAAPSNPRIKILLISGYSPLTHYSHHLQSVCARYFRCIRTPWLASVLPASLYLQFHLPCLASASREDEAAVAPAGVTAAALAGTRHLGRLDCAASGSPFRGGWLLQTRTVA